jgi:hypothetical protein
MAFASLVVNSKFRSSGEEIARPAVSSDVPFVEQGSEYELDQCSGTTKVPPISPELPYAAAVMPSTKHLVHTSSSSDTTSSMVILKRFNFQEMVPILVSESELDAAKTALISRFGDVDVHAAEELVRVALVELCGSSCTSESLKTTLSRCGSMDAFRSLGMLEGAHKANKMVKLSDDELLLFVAVKSTKVHHKPYTKNPHKSLFTLLTGRSNNWWDTHHRQMLVRICQKPRQRDPPKPRRQYSKTLSEYRRMQTALAAQRLQRSQRENQHRMKCCYECKETKKWAAFKRIHLKGKDVPIARCTYCTDSAIAYATLIA